MDSCKLDKMPKQASLSCAKFLLSGEYAVLVGGKAIALPLTRLQLQYKESPLSAIEIKDFSNQHKLILNENEISNQDEIDKLLKLRSLFTNSKDPSLIEVSTQIPIGKGLGSSAALCVAMARYFYPSLPPLEIARKAFEGEKIFHGNPSGVDPYCVAFEVPMIFKKDSQSFDPLDTTHLKQSDLVFFLRDSGGSHKTKSLINDVQKKTNALEELKELSDLMTEYVLKDASKIPGLMNEIQTKLVGLGVSSPLIETNIQELLSLGALGAKITGSGQGGFVVSVFDLNTYSKLPLIVKNSGVSWSPT